RSRQGRARAGLSHSRDVAGQDHPHEAAKSGRRLADPASRSGVVMSALEHIPVGVVVERIKADSPWIDHVWRPSAVLVGEPDATPWTRLSGDDARAAYYAGSISIELYRSDTGNYRDNLAGDRKLWVVLTPTEADPPYALFKVTADPTEGEAQTETGVNLVE